MTRYRRWFMTGAVMAALVIFGVMAMFYPYRYVLAFQQMPNKELAAYLPVSESDHFQLKFTHSVHLTDVYEEYELRDNHLIPVQLIYEDTAIGMPSNAGKNETFEMKDGKYYITDLQGSHQSISLFVGQVRAKHTIIYNDQSYLLKDYVGAGAWINIETQHRSNWELMRGVKLGE